MPVLWYSVSICLTWALPQCGCCLFWHAGGKRAEGKEAAVAGSRALKLLSCHWGSASCETKEEDASQRLGPYVRVHLKVRGPLSPCCLARDLTWLGCDRS
jgi:hypothetical protein